MLGAFFVVGLVVIVSIIGSIGAVPALFGSLPDKFWEWKYAPIVPAGVLILVFILYAIKITK